MKSIFDKHREAIAKQNANMPEPMRAVMNPHESAKQFPSHIMTMAELKEYIDLKKKIFADTPFVILDLNNPEEKRYEELTPKYLAFRRYVTKQNY
jgi:hypothetical protein